MRAMTNMKKKLIVVGLGLAVAGGSYAAAAALGVTSTTLGAGDATVASCDANGINAAYTSAYNATTGVFEVTSVDLTNIATGCNGKVLTVVLSGPLASTAVLDTATVTAGNTGSETVAMAAGADASDVTGVHVQLNG